MNRKALSERDICTKFILPAVKQAGWDAPLQIREEVRFTKGRIIVRGGLVTRGQAKRADGILFCKPQRPYPGCRQWPDPRPITTCSSSPEFPTSTVASSNQCVNRLGTIGSISIGSAAVSITNSSHFMLVVVLNPWPYHTAVKRALHSFVTGNEIPYECS